MNGLSWKHKVAAAYRWAEDRGEPMPPGIPETAPRVFDLVRRYEQSWEPDNRARAELAAKIVGDGHLPDRSWSPELSAYMALCRRQWTANLERWAARNRAAMSGAAQDEREAMRDLQRGLGLSATAAADG